MSYRVTIHKYVHGGAMPDDAFLIKCINMPFPPYPGLDIHVGNVAAKVESVAWDAGTNQFDVYAPDDDFLRRAALETIGTLGLEQRVQQWLNCGWELDER